MTCSFAIISNRKREAFTQQREGYTVRRACSSSKATFLDMIGTRDRYDSRGSCTRSLRLARALYFSPSISHPYNRIHANYNALVSKSYANRSDRWTSGYASRTVLTEIDMVWICRPEVAERFQPLLRRFPNLEIVYDTIDLHFVRKRRQAELTGGVAGADWGTDRIREIACARSADATITVTETEREVLESFAIAPIYVVPTVHSRRVT